MSIVAILIPLFSTLRRSLSFVSLILSQFYQCFKCLIQSLGSVPFFIFWVRESSVVLGFLVHCRELTRSRCDLFVGAPVRGSYVLEVSWG